MDNPRLRVGCSGRQYRHWRGVFYPADLAQARWFEFYARAFDTVEINNSFYRLPGASTFRRWHERAPRGFLFAVKASRYLTHMKKLKDPEPPLELFFSRARELGPALGPVLYQLPPRWPVNVDRLKVFLAALPPGVAHVIEFRNASWYTPEVFWLLGSFQVALCLHDMPGSATMLNPQVRSCTFDSTGREPDTGAATRTNSSRGTRRGFARACEIVPSLPISTTTRAETPLMTRRG